MWDIFLYAAFVLNRQCLTRKPQLACRMPSLPFHQLTLGLATVLSIYKRIDLRNTI